MERSIYIGISTLTRTGWQALWDQTTLDDTQIEHHLMDARQEFKDRIAWVGGWRSIFKIWGRVIKLLIKNPQARDAIKQQLDVPPEVADLMGYTILAGRKP